MNSTNRAGVSVRTLVSLLVCTVLVCLIAAAVVGIRAQMRRSGEQTGKGATDWFQAGVGLGQNLFDPRAGFPGKGRVTIACMGIDDNWTDSDEVYTRGARTDTLFLLSLDLDNKKAAILSIPRDAYVPIAGTDYKDKINSAYSSGGPKRTMATIANVLGVSPDYYIVIRIDGTKKMVDALGGVDVNVENPLNYDDNWGHLHVHLQPGLQHLTGDQAVGFARYRHGNHGVTPEDGDERRIYRQHVLVRAMVDRIKSLGNLVKPDALIDTAMSCIDTDLSRTQLFDLAALFHSVQQDDIQTAQIPGVDGKTPRGMYILTLDPQKASLLTDWLIRGNDGAGRAVTPVVVKNATAVRGLAATAGETIKTYGYTDVHVGNYDKRGTASSSVIIDSGVANRKAAPDIAGIIGVPAQSIVRETPKPNRSGWAPPPAITVVLGSDYSASHPVAPIPSATSSASARTE